MFKLATKPTFLAPVVAHIPADRGKFETIKFHVRFKRPTLSEYQALMTRLEESRVEAKTDRAPRSFGDRELIDEVLDGFGDDLVDEDGSALAFTPENVDRLCNVFPIQPRIVASFFEYYGKAAEKN